MVREFKLPDVGEGVSEGEIVEWLVEEGDPVSEDQPVAEVETDKAVVDIPSPVDGVVQELHAAAGEVVKVGSVIVTFAVEGEADATADEGSDTPASADAGAGGQGARVFAPPSVRRLARELDVDLTAVEGTGPSGRITEGDVRTAAESEGGETAAESSGPKSVVTRVDSGSEPGDADTAEATTAEATPAGPAPAGRERTLAAPSTRRVAEELGVDIDDVPTDTERDGQPFVSEDAVRAYADAQRQAQAADAAAVTAGGEAAGGTATADTTEVATVDEPTEVTPAETRLVTAETDAEPTETAAETARPDQEEREAYRGIRRTIGRQMERSKFTAPHVTHHDQVDVTDLVELREDLRGAADAAGVKLTYTAFVVKACTVALREFPYLNAQLDTAAEEIVKKQYYNVGVAVDTEAGLMVPVVEDADGRSLREIAATIAEKAERARDRSITREEMQGGTFTITNVGAIGGEYATPIINYPEVAILALGAIEQRPQVVDGEVVARHTLPLSLSFDHRVVDGATAARFTNRVGELLANPKRLLIE